MKKGPMPLDPHLYFADFTLAILLKLFALPAYLNWQAGVTSRASSSISTNPVCIRFLKLLGAKGVATRDGSRFQAGREPTRTLCRRAMRKRVRHNITLRLSLQSIVANS